MYSPFYSVSQAPFYVYVTFERHTDYLHVLRMDRKQVPDELSLLKELNLKESPVPDEITWENRGQNNRWRQRAFLAAALIALFAFEWVCIFVIDLMIRFMYKTSYSRFRFAERCPTYENAFENDLSSYESWATVDLNLLSKDAMTGIY